MIASVGPNAIGYDDVGTGLPVVFIHGFPHDRSLWSSQLGSLAVPTRTLACDLRGFGESTGIVTTLDDYAADISAWVRGLGIERAVFVGLSMGGYILFALWRKDPTLFRALALVDTRAGPDDAAGKARRDEHIALVRAKGPGALADQLVQGMLGKTTREQRPELTESIHAMLSRAPIPGIIGALQAMRDRPDSAATLAAIDVPTLIVVGDEDVLTPVREATAMNDAIDGSVLQVLTGAGHLSSVERPAGFNHVLGEFLATLTYA